MSAPPEAKRRYVAVVPELAVGFLSCTDCGALVWHSNRPVHDEHHTGLANLREQVEALIDGNHAHARYVDEAFDRIEALEGRS